MTESSWRAAAVALIAVALLTAAAQHSLAQTPRARVTIGYVEIAGDVRHQPITGFGRLVLKTREHPFAGAQVGLDEAQALSRVLNVDFALERISVGSAAEIAEAVLTARAQNDVHFFLIDAPAEAFKPLTQAVRGRDVLLFNIT